MPKGVLKIERKCLNEFPKFGESKKRIAKTVLHPTDLIENLQEGLHADFANEVKLNS